MATIMKNCPNCTLTQEEFYFVYEVAGETKKHKICINCHYEIHRNGTKKIAVQRKRLELMINQLKTPLPKYKTRKRRKKQK
jgi:hypothetical protein